MTWSGPLTKRGRIMRANTPKSRKKRNSKRKMLDSFVLKLQQPKSQMKWKKRDDCFNCKCVKYVIFSNSSLNFTDPIKLNYNKVNITIDFAVILFEQGIWDTSYINSMTHFKLTKYSWNIQYPSGKNSPGPRSTWYILENLDNGPAWH